jgi:PsbP-like protein
LRNKRSPLLAVILLFAVLLLIAAPLLIRQSILPQAPVDDSRLIDYRNPTLGFSLQRPEAWEISEDENLILSGVSPTMDAVAFVPKNSPNTFIIMYVQTLSNTETLDSYAARQVADLQNNDSQMKFSPSRPVKINGLDALETEAISNVNGEARQLRMIMLLNGLRAYALTYFGPVGGTAPQRFQSMIDSFEFVR